MAIAIREAPTCTLPLCVCERVCRTFAFRLTARPLTHLFRRFFLVDRVVAARFVKVPLRWPAATSRWFFCGREELFVEQGRLQRSVQAERKGSVLD